MLRSDDAARAPLPGGRTLLALLSLGLLILLCAAGIPLAGMVIGSFAGGPVEIRSWMRVHNTVILGCHLVVLAGLLRGTWPALAGAAPGREQRLARAVARPLLLCTLAPLLGMLLFPLVLGSGPWPAGDPAIGLLRVLVFAPGVLRALALAALGLALVPAPRRPRPWQRPVGAVVALLFAADLCLCVHRWASTPRAVMALLHPLSGQPLLMVPWFVAALLLFSLLLRSRA